MPVGRESDYGGLFLKAVPFSVLSVAWPIRFNCIPSSLTFSDVFQIHVVSPRRTAYII